MKITLKVLLALLIVLFFSLYYSKYSNYYYYENQKVLTDEAIKRFESDLKEGKKININNYIPEQKNYNNKVSILVLKTSNFIDKCFSKGLKLFAKYISKLENS